MQNQPIILYVGWALLTGIVLVLAVYRKVVAKQEDDTLHVGDGDSQTIAKQAEVAQKLAQIDLWGKSLTVVAFLYTLTLLGMYLYSVWTANANYMGG